MEPTPHHILYLEDHDDTRDLVTLVLSERNYVVTTAVTIADAWKLAREYPFDLYVLDSLLPDGSGIDLCKSLRKLDPSIPIMFLSGAAYATDKERAIKSGAQCYLVKPADLDVMCSEVKRLVDEAAKNRKPVDARATAKGNLCGLATS